MTFKNAKSLFGVSLMAVAILSITGIVFVDAEKSDNTNITAKVIERNADAWKSQYDSEKHFVVTTKETVEYLTADLEPGWNTDVQQAALKSYNLNSMIGKRDAADQLVSLISTRAQLDGTYSETEAVERYHSFMQSQFPAPNSIQGIDAKINHRKKIELWGNGTVTRDFLYVDDAAKSFLLSAEISEQYSPLNIGSRREISIKELVSMLMNIIGVNFEIDWNKDKPSGTNRRLLDISKAKTQINFEPEISLDNGLKLTVDWYKKTILEKN